MSYVYEGTSLSEVSIDQQAQTLNRKTHAHLESDPRFQKKVTLKPKPDETYMTKMFLQEQKDRKREALLDSADFFLELHRKTGWPILADHYTRIYPSGAFTFTDRRLLNVLNDAADSLSSDWQEEGGILRFRRSNYYTERRHDVPHPLLLKWASAKKQRGYLTLDELAEMTMLPWNVLNHMKLGDAVSKKYGLDEWALGGMVGLRLYQLLDGPQRQLAQTKEGLPITRLSTDQAHRFIRIVEGELNRKGDWDFDWGEETDHFNSRQMTPEQFSQSKFFIHLREPNSYEWYDPGRGRTMDTLQALYPPHAAVKESSREEAEAKVEALMKEQGGGPGAAKMMKEGIAGGDTGVIYALNVGEWYLVESLNSRFSARGRAFKGLFARDEN